MAVKTAMTPSRFFTARLLILTVATSVALGACSQASEDSATFSESAIAHQESANQTNSGEAATDGQASKSALPASFEDRSIAFTAHVELESDDPAEAQNRTVALIEAKGGIVFRQDAVYDDNPSVNMTLKVPPTELEAFITGLSKFGDIIRSDKSAEDVTEAVVDLESRIANAAKSVERTRAYLDQATDLVQLSTLEGELTRRETDLEILVGQQRQLTSRTDMATLTLNISTDGTVDADDDEISGFSAAFSDGFGALKEIGLVAATVFGFSLPFLFVLVFIGVPLRILWKKRSPAPSAG